MRGSLYGSLRSSLVLASAVAGSLLLASVAGANPPLANSSFEIVGAGGSPTFHNPTLPGGAGLSAAASWGVFHNTGGGSVTITELVPTTLPGGGFRMLNVVSAGQLNGIVQTTGPPGSGAQHCTASAWVFVNSGVVGMGAGNHGNTAATSVVSTTTGAWEHLQTQNLQEPCNTIVLYSIGPGVDFFVEEAELLEHQELEDPAPVEYSNFFDERAIVGGGNHAGLDPGQVLYTEPVDGAADSNPQDGVDFFPGIESDNEPDAQVDALANGADGFFDQVVADKADLLISIQGDPGPTQPVAAYYEEPSGATGIQYTQRDLNAVNGPGDLDDVDGLELWRDMDDPNLSDADYFSLFGDHSGTSVWHFLSGAPAPYVGKTVILGAVVPLGYEGQAVDVDVDALMVKDTGVAGVWDEGDEILFSIRSAGGWTGAEIVHLPFGAPASFLFHGGHNWDPSFILTSAFPVEDGDQEVDAIEAVPEPGAVALLAGGTLLLWRLDARRRRRPAL